jgi:hypothetical protein
MRSGAIRAWLYANWFYAGLTASLFLFAVTPLLWNVESRSLLVVFLQLPIYMVHEVEEHYHDRFRLFFNEKLAGGRNALTPDAVLVSNLGGVWGVDLTALYLAHFVNPGLGLIAMYLAIVNAFVHIAAAVAFRAYNPGLVTAILLLLPAGSAGWWVLARDAQCTVYDHVWGLGMAITLHAAILLHVRRRINQLKRPGNINRSDQAF